MSDQQVPLESSTMSAPSTKHAQHLRMACSGDIVTVDMNLRTENGMVLQPLFDTSGRVSFVLGEGNYLPGLHELVEGMRIGDSISGVSIDGGWGKRKPGLVIEIPRSKMNEMLTEEQDIADLQVGASLHLKGVQVTVVQVSDETVTVDANHPLAGAGYTCDLTVIDVQPYPKSKVLYHDIKTNDESPYEVATWGAGCFWGVELAFQRVPGVVGTKVGYTQGIKVDPTYEEVCQGTTQHREALMVVYDTRVVSYDELIQVFMDRLASTLNQYQVGNLFDEEDAEEDPSTLQYKHGIYFHTKHQKEQASAAISANGNKYNVELRQAATFYRAEECHQQYLLKGGQSARKGCKESIRCFG